MKSLDSFPRVSLGVFPTPIQKLENTSKLLHTNVYVKRDDLTGLGLGGNKTRKLEFLLADAKNRGAEIVFTTGGASVGDYDFAASTAQAIGAEPLFWKVRMKPGGALLVSRLGSKLLVSLSGNPAAALMSLLVVLRPWLMALTGSEDRACFVSLPLKEDMPKTAGSLRLLRGHLDFYRRRRLLCRARGPWQRQYRLLCPL